MLDETSFQNLAAVAATDRQSPGRSDSGCSWDDQYDAEEVRDARLTCAPANQGQADCKKGCHSENRFHDDTENLGSEVVGSRGGYHKAWLSRRHERRHLCG